MSTVIRARDTRPQTGLDRDLRRKNIKGAFEIVSTPAQEHVAIVDDVITTGSTVNELARVLKRAGVKRVDVCAAGQGRWLRLTAKSRIDRPHNRLT